MKSLPVKCKLDHVSFELQEQHDFEWLQSLGTVFCVFDQQDSGNISFGVEKNGTRLFVKYAGCRPMDYSGDPRDAVARLSAAVPLYKTLEHPHLIKLINHFETRDGYAAVFEWFKGECLHSHWLFAGDAKHTHPDSPYCKFKQLPIEKRLRSLDVIYEFHKHVESKGCVAVDFYDGSILYDFSTDVTMICDIDFYRTAPSVNDLGENFWGAVRSKSPEEFTLGAPIDARTNVFTMGAIAFGLLGGEMDLSFSKWEAGRSLYEVALRAVSKEREQRYTSVSEFKYAWDAALIS
ncbi:serine/threonine protein kinase [Paenibacillus sambharensis]|uniref:Serine/threonine protein kinase n=1 Tax=Paenibacillus sambharensis TaxID=1803190 RepID=A0A2W1LQL3_9BACL|nr:serine/threonine protein kinase [Paenibacillus sambharensis]PZD97135.1 serine/threonine protein kinase [Paenibacillus sambharensis]